MSVETTHHQSSQINPATSTLPLQQWVEHYANNTPQATALIHDHKPITYAQLNHQANQLANALHEHYRRVMGMDITANTLIPMCCERDATLMITILAILKTGAAYMPVDAELPQHRIDMMLDDANANMVVTCSQYTTQFKQYPCLLVDAPEWQQAGSDTPNIQTTTDDLAYTLYTSGTTGAPKGVMIEHHSFSACLRAFKHIISKTSTSKRLFVMSLTHASFDIFGLEFGLAWMTGGTLLLSSWNRFPMDFDQYHEQIDVIQQTPAVLTSLVASLPRPLTPHDMTCLVGGDVVSSQTIACLREYFDAVINVYGPTETTIWSSYYHCQSDNISFIGQPTEDEEMVLLDEKMNVVSDGTIGEIAISGAGLARGYRNKVDETKQRFIHHKSLDRRMYLTGDLGRQHESGNVEYVGRKDTQIKIQGHRIELIEIEQTITKLDAISHCIVIKSQNQLVAYYTATNPLCDSALISHVTDQLPLYMIPTQWVYQNQLPLTRNGKVDRQRIQKKQDETNSTWVAPTTPRQKELCLIWQDVFGVSQVGIEDHFHRLGGNSIQAMRCIARIENQLDIKVSIADFMRCGSIVKLDDLLQHKNHATITPEGKQRSPISSQQKSMLFLDETTEGISPYHIPLLFKLNKTANKNKIMNAIIHLCDAHQVLKSVYALNCHHEHEQIIVDMDIDHRSISCLNQGVFNRKVQSEIEKPFDLEAELPIRITFVKHLEEGSLFLLIVVHHIAFDGISEAIFIDAIQGNGTAWPPYQYGDYATSTLKDKDQKTGMDYWKRQLKDVNKVAYPNETLPHNATENKALTIIRRIPNPHQLHDAAKDMNCSLYVFMLSAFYVTLYLHTGCKDMIVGSPMANRDSHHGLSKLIGYFVNTLPLRKTISDLNQDVSAFVDDVKEIVMDALTHQNIALLDIIRDCDIDRTSGSNPLFDILFGVQQDSPKALTNKDPLEQLPTDSYYQANVSPMVMMIRESEFIDCSLTVNSSLMSKETAESFIDHYINMVSYFSEKPTQPILRDASVDTLSSEQGHVERRSLISIWDSVVDSQGHHTALKFNDKTMTYTELDHASSQIAYTLQQRYLETNDQALEPESLIGVCMERGMEMVASLLAVIKLGCAYVPIDPQYPQARIDFIVKDANPEIVIVNGGADNLFDDQLCFHTKSVDMDSTTPLTITPSPLNHLAYVIYTSGTTGKPKGVMVEHASVVNLITELKKQFLMSDHSTVLQFSPLVFDASVWEIFPTLFNGATLCIATNEERHDNNYLLDMMENNQVTHATIPPVVLSSMPYRQLPDCQYMIIAGESCDPHTVKQWANGRNFINAYGPTEGTVCSTMHVYQDGDHHANIGHSISHAFFMVLNDDGIPVPVGAIGELYLGGANLARGYLNNEKANNEQFVSIGPNKTKLYRSGDFVRVLPNQELEFIGRKDSQAKINGQRIDLSEIESVIRDFNGISQSCVTLYDDGNKSLVAYYCAHSFIDHDTLSAFIADKLPAIMTPKWYIQVDELPITINGKVDQTKLPKPNNQKAQSDIKHRVQTAWKEVLRVTITDQDDDFFDSGGDSILAMKLALKIEALIGHRIPVSMILSQRSLQGLITSIEQMPKNKSAAIPSRMNVNNEYPLSFAQLRMWTQYQTNKQSCSYHIPMLIHLKQTIRSHDVIESIRHILSQQQVLRSHFTLNGEGHPSMTVKSNELTVTEHKHHDEHDMRQAMLSDAKKSFDLEKNIPIRVHVYSLNHTQAEQVYLMINIHHIAFDGWSLECFYQLISQYIQHKTTESHRIEHQHTQYYDYTDWEKNQDFSSSKTYWLQHLSGASSINPLNSYAESNGHTPAGRSMIVPLSKAMMSDIQRHLSGSKASLHDFFLAIFALVLYRTSGNDQFCIGMPIANRCRAELKDIVGYFVNTIALKVGIDPSLSVSTFLDTVSDFMLASQDHQSFPLETIFSSLDLSRAALDHPLFSVFYTFHELTQSTQSAISTLSDDPIELIDMGVAKFDLSLFVNKDADQIALEFNYRSDKYSQDAIQSIVDRYLNMIEHLMGSPETQCIDLGIRAEEFIPLTHHQAINATVPLDHNDTLVSWFGDTASRHSDRTAITDQDHSITFRQLDMQSNQIARCIEQSTVDRFSSHVSTGDRIAVVVERSPVFYATLIAILKLGCCYVPISVDFPDQRKKDLIIDSDAKLVIVSSNECVASPLNDTVVLNIHQVNWNALSSQPIDAPVQSQDLAYVMYTSGSSGKPKGAMIEHHSVVHLLRWFKSTFNVTPEDAIIQKTPCVFDVSVWEIFLPLVCGATLVMARPNGEKDPLYLNDLIAKHQIPLIHFVPSMLEVYLLHLESANQSLPACIQSLLIGGETLKPYVYEQLLSSLQNPSIQIYNTYGPTETCVDVLCGPMNPSKPSIMGHPIGDVEACIIHPDGRPVPLGGTGELCISGPCLARGYIDSALDIDSFIDHSRISIRSSSGRWYKTGDLIKYHGEGQLEYVGRKDTQIKISGYRIDCQEIESALLAHEVITQCVISTIVINKDNNSLVAYYVSDEPLDDERIKLFLTQSLPKYMIPSYFHALETMPILASGKIDKKALPKITKPSADLFISPKTVTEVIIAGHISTLFSMDKVSVNVHFFELGGNSLLAIRLLAKLMDAFSIKISLSDLYNHPVLSDMAAFVDAQKPNSLGIPQPLEKSLSEPSLSSNQRLIVKYLQRNPQSISFQSGIAFTINQALDVDQFKSALLKVIHEFVLLRTQLTIDTSHTKIHIANSQEFQLDDVLSISQETNQIANTLIENRRLAMSRNPFDYDNSYLYRIELMKRDDGHTSVIACFSKLVTDGYGLSLFLDHLMSNYLGVSPHTTLSDYDYFDYAAWENNNIHSSFFDNSITYWKQQNLTSTQRDIITLDYPRPKRMNALCSCSDTTLSHGLTTLIREFCHSNNISIYTFFFSAWTYYLSTLSCERAFLVSCVYRNRGGRIELDAIPGPFSDFIPINIDLNKININHASYFASIEHTIRSAIDHFVPYGHLLDHLGVNESDMDYYCNAPITQTAVNFPSPYSETDRNRQTESIALDFIKQTRHTTSFDISVVITESREHLGISLNYRQELFTEATIITHLESFKHILAFLLTNKGVIYEPCHLSVG